MSNNIRLLVGIVAGAAIVYLAVFVIPFLQPFKGIVQSMPMSYGDMTQAIYFVVSLALMIILSRGKLYEYGFRLVAFKPLLKAVLISIPVMLVLMVIMMISVMLSGVMPGSYGPVGQMGMSLNKAIISVWLIASTCEELFFRGLLYGFLAPLKEKGFSLFRIQISLPVTVCALMFGLGHLCLLSMMPGVMVANIVVATTICGFIAGYFREQTGSLIPAIAVHMTFNIVGSTLPLLAG